MSLVPCSRHASRVPETAVSHRAAQNMGSTVRAHGSQHTTYRAPARGAAHPLSPHTTEPRPALLLHMRWRRRSIPPAAPRHERHRHCRRQHMVVYVVSGLHASLSQNDQPLELRSGAIFDGSHARNRRAHCLVRLLVLARKRRGMRCLVRLLVLLLLLVRHAAPLGAKGLANLCAQ